MTRLSADQIERARRLLERRSELGLHETNALLSEVFAEEGWQDQAQMLQLIRDELERRETGANDAKEAPDP